MESYIRFELLQRPKNKKTDTWAVETRDGKIQLGSIRWFGRWRRYAFFVAPQMVFEEVCLREIAETIENLTAIHKAYQKKEKA